MSGLALTSAVAALDRIAPPALAEEWDNVGLLVSPSEPRPVRRALLTIDLTEPVLEEALEEDCDLVVAYHPPLFEPTRRLLSSVTQQRILVRAIEAQVAIHSPHTALDAAPGGVNDWLADGLGGGLRRPIQRPRESVVLGRGGEGVLDAEVAGQGRWVALEGPASLDDLVDRIKGHLGLEHVRVAAADRHGAGDPVASVALCAGAGGDVLAGVEADLFLTGEMRHHDILAAVAAGTSVVVCDHTNTERGVLGPLKRRLDEVWDAVSVLISRTDADPLQVR